MSIRKDIAIDENGNWLVENGDFKVIESDEQHVDLLLRSTKGSFREFPLTGVGIVNYLKKQNNNINALKREVMVNLQADGYKYNGLAFDANNEFTLDFEANYE